MSSDMPRPVVYLEGDRLYARPLELSDLHRCQRWINDPATRRTLAHHLPVSEIGERKHIEGVCEGGDRISLAIVLRADHRHIGVMSLMEFGWKNRSATFAIMIGEAECRGQGYGTEATQMMVRYAFETLNLNRLQLGVFATNQPAIRVYENIGFVREGVAREHSFIEGRYVDHVNYAMLAREYFQGRHQEFGDSGRGGRETGM
jgi:RimJ/RimL family protein N-acetyltransferase